MLLGAHPRRHAARPGRPGQALAHRAPVRPDGAEPDHGHGGRAGTGPTTSCRSPSPSCSPWPPTPPSAGCPCWPACVATGQLPAPPVHHLRGDRQVFANGIWALAVMAGRAARRRRAATPTPSSRSSPSGSSSASRCPRAGLVVHWRRTRPPGWRRRATINGLGAVSPPSPPSSSSSRSSPRVPGWSSSPSRPSSSSSCASTPTTSGPGRTSGSTRSRASPGRSTPSSSCRSTGLRLTEHALCEARVARPGGDRRDGRPARRGRAHTTTPSSSRQQWTVGPRRAAARAPHRVRLRRAADRRLHRRAARRTPTIRSSCSSRSLGDRLRYRILHNQIDLALSAALLTRPNVVIVRVLIPLHQAAAKTA